MKDNNKIIAKCVVDVMRNLHDFGFSDCDENNIWTNKIYNFQLEIKLKHHYSDDDVKRIMIYFQNIQAQKLNPENIKNAQEIVKQPIKHNSKELKSNKPKKKF